MTKASFHGSKLRGPALAIEPTLDYGPQVRRGSGGRITILPGAAEIVIADRPDPDHEGTDRDRGKTARTTRGARRYDGIVALYGERSAEHLACERFRDDCAVAEGARIAGDGPRVRVAHDSSVYGPSDRILDAQARVQAAWKGMGIARGEWVWEVVSWVVLGNGSINKFCSFERLDKRRVRNILHKAVADLVAHYDEADRHGGRISA